ncbi:hypothetical protein GOP47_0020579 [Adiantum capillus-veneris]|uniref:Uncharacterized protein n=1 Tax=Adiantum capillus-veneris TaxID=13818 RepID=A0A9D4Z739_ADICA|nr:hypothetical protein GOP47_0020579 [Adiantum capillus-veneris]
MPPEKPISAPATKPEPTTAEAADKELTLNELAEMQLRERLETLHERYHWKSLRWEQCILHSENVAHLTPQQINEP